MSTAPVSTPQILDRLKELRADFADGNAQLAELDRRQHDLRDQVLRIEGAIRVLEELLAGAPARGAGPADARDDLDLDLDVGAGPGTA
ncbi:hypothetical protein Xcel_1945 [Xylanimonas cellulosilytica DSM 15894]|uniref:Uncharacterized protein n=1 Tax=Xylanimonas cellulosilytica (strain DSM 15894 / JCM 12276 / CECT 5975 / KCTC 9989 / LMG 20990 / NBRC 107835 / XIL07) TaxID=446471 RepID=D1BTI5_XYLCX|nr:hypothetical protein [Xylanimonas cellulosilytica]ACZ30964.1 hypothetical protein Xcel_1945 [Xylanimonas cellulosilytica DSM 15894]